MRFTSSVANTSASEHSERFSSWTAGELAARFIISWLA